MRKSAAPSKLAKKDGRSFFTPPYKTPVPLHKLQIQSQTECKVANFVACKTNIIRERKENEEKEVDQLLEIDHVQNNKCLVSISKHVIELKENLCVKDTNFNAQYFSVVWGKLSKKKHKSWDGDAVLIVKERSVILKDMEGKEIGRSLGYKLADLQTLEEGNTLPVGMKEIEIQSKIKAEDYISGKCFQENTMQVSKVEDHLPFVNDRPKPKPFRLPFRDLSLIPNKTKKKALEPLHSISDPDALVLPRPPCSHQSRARSNISDDIVDVVVDPHLCRELRPHQRDGVTFLYECIMGFKAKEFEGAILADEMGLGKTLQCITIVWTLLRQGPYGGVPILKKVLIVTPSSLVINWKKEFNKWLGNQRIHVYAVDQNNKVSKFQIQKVSSIMIVSYEMLIRCIDDIKNIKFDLMLCDEGHRLKNSQIKTTSLIKSLDINKRIILTGTPIQNDLQEYFALVDFVNCGVLGRPAMFRKVYEEPILRSQQPSASDEEKELGTSRATELNRLSSLFILRRTQEIINKYLPAKTEYVVFCQSSESQSAAYKSALKSSFVRGCLYNSGDHLAAICLLRKISNHPSLIKHNNNDELILASDFQNIESILPENVAKNEFLEEDSGKLAVVSCMLYSLHEFSNEKIVIVSNFTSTLDMLEKVCQRYDYKFLRLDGSTPSSKRQNLVDRFNAHYGQERVFLLSSKAGGVGLNLIGASRIVLFDIDWNPANDLQAMARVWRDGQKKHVYIYRLLLAGSIEEKMYQRQVCKQGISGSVIDARTNKSHFSTEELKDLFRYEEGAQCLTHSLMQCACEQNGSNKPPVALFNTDRGSEFGNTESKSKSNATMDQLLCWQHFNMPQNVGDNHLESGADFISFVFKCDVSQKSDLLSV